jgi:hypothetical protein
LVVRDFDACDVDEQDNISGYNKTFAFNDISLFAIPDRIG